jgi:hypothetical protein
MNSAVMNEEENRQILIGCGILKKEINWLIKENNWQLSTSFFDSSLHVDFEKLYMNLKLAIDKLSDQEPIVFYGACHPLIDNFLYDANVIRTKGQNCVEILLGHDLFTEELSAGAYFLLEDWALRWNYIITKTFGPNMEITRQIFQEDRKYLLGLRTPCSGNFTKEAELAAQSVGLPLKWMDVGFDHLQSVLASVLKQKNGQCYGR